MNCNPGHELLTLKSVWLKDSQVRVRVRKIGESKKIAVDMQVLTPESSEIPSSSELKRIACDAAVLCGAASRDYSKLYDYQTDRKAERLDGSKVLTHIHELSLAFHGV
ncbi:hypothetical protein MADRUGA_55 [Mycobacterium phage Madruga]|uniref:Uncharacterized protein n=1 Tax=Mycobacterium phage Madruga TaxID=1675552 RepID=A0A0K1LT84_9CAUD|nr:hypothetical protein MADRUGA_55 [Mycobacterium phage Madruga]